MFTIIITIIGNVLLFVFVAARNHYVHTLSQSKVPSYPNDSTIFWPLAKNISQILSKSYSALLISKNDIFTHWKRKLPC